MKKIGRLLAAVLAVMVLGGCEEEDSPLRFETVENTEPQNVKIDYYSVDPSCQPRRYYITTNRLGGELTIKCTNARNIYFAEIGENSRAEYGVSDSGVVDVNTLVFNDGNWTVSVVDHNSLRFVFRETPVNPDLDFVLENDYVNVCAKDKNKVLETSITVWRSLNMDEAIDMAE